MNQANAEYRWENGIITAGFCDEMPFNQNRFTPIGGDIGEKDSDFEVSEIPAYLPSGEGEHLYLWIEKMGKSTMDATKAIEKAFDVKETDVGCAGKKDVHAVTRQWISVCTRKDHQTAIEKLNELGWMKILQVTRHTNKIHMGHLRGNLFKIRLTGVHASDDDIQSSLQTLTQEGIINYFGKQRFGFNGDNIALGLQTMAGGTKAPHKLKKLYVSAIQSAIFNLIAARRFVQNGWEVCQGDVMQKINAGCFVCDDPQTDAERAKKGEIVVTLPLIGKKFMHGQGVCEQQMQDAVQDFFEHWQTKLQNVPIHPEMINKFADGARRAYWVRPDRLSFQRIDSTSVSIEFALPSGSYATVFLRHLCGDSFTR